MNTYISLSRENHGYMEFFASADERGISLIYFKDTKEEYIDLLQTLALTTKKDAIFIRVRTREEFRKRVYEMRENYNTDNIQSRNDFDSMLMIGEYKD
jgi:3-dehydroquinate dehydratase